MGMEKHAQLAPSQKENLAKSTTSRGVMPAMTVSWDMPYVYEASPGSGETTRMAGREPSLDLLAG